MSIKFIWEMCRLSSIFPINFLSGWLIHGSEWSFEVTYFMLLSISPFRSVQFCPAVSDSWQPHGLQHARPPCPSSTPRVCSNSCPLSQWCHPTMSFSIILFSSCLQSFPASGSLPMSQFFASGGQNKNLGLKLGARTLTKYIQVCRLGTK